MDADEVLDFATVFIPDLRTPDMEPAQAEKAREKTAKNRNKFLGYLTSATVPEDLKFTRYGMLQAGVEYLDWSGNSRKDETRFSRVMLTGDAPKQRLLQLVAGS
jgi:hypothetical protein